MDKTSALKNAIEFAKQNPNSPQAQQLRKRIESGMYQAEMAQITKVPFEHRNTAQSVLGAFLDPIIETGVRAGQAVGDLALTGINKISGGALDKYTPEGNLSQALDRAENTATKVPVLGTVIRPVDELTPENIAGNAIKTVSLGVSSPALAGAGLLGGQAMSEDKSLGDVALNTVAGAIGGKILEYGFNALAPYVEKAGAKYGKPFLDKISQYVPESGKTFFTNLESKLATVESKLPNIAEKNLPPKISNAIKTVEEKASSVVESVVTLPEKGLGYIKNKLIPNSAKENVANVLKNTGKKTLGQAGSSKQLDDATEAFDIIRQNAPNVKVKDINGTEKVFDPKTANFYELPQALKQTKDAVYKEYTNLATQAGDAGVTFGKEDFKLLNELLKKYKGKGYTPSFSNKAKQFEEALKRFKGKATPEEMQGLIEKVNLDVNPASDKAGNKVASDFSSALRKALDDKLEASGNPAYQATRDKYAKLKSIEQDVITRYKEALRKAGAKPDIIDHITSMDVLYGILTGNPTHLALGVGAKVFKATLGKVLGAEASLQRAFGALETGAKSAVAGAVKINPVVVENAPKGNFLNIGMNKGTTAEKITEAQIRKALPKDVKITSSKIVKGETEDTFIPKLSRKLTDKEMDALLTATEQKAIPQLSDGTGTMHGSNEWGDFNPEYFLDLKGKPILKGKGETPATTTKFDTPEIIKLRQENASMQPTHLINTPERVAFREKVANDAYATNNGTNIPVKQERKAILATGLPATGKSTVVVGQAEKSGYRTIDSDIYKEAIPESAGGKYNAVVHVESDIIRSNIMERAIRNGDNISLPLIGRNLEKTIKILDKLKKLGYDIQLHQLDLPIEKAQQRTISRFLKTGKFVDPLYVQGIGNAPAENYAVFKNHPAVSSATRYNTDVPMGSKYIVTENYVK